MIAYHVEVNGKHVAIAGLEQGVISAISNLVFIPSDIAKDPEKDWSAGFSLGGLDNKTDEHIKWFRCDLKPGDQITLKLVDVDADEIDVPEERYHRDQKEPRGD